MELQDHAATAATVIVALIGRDVLSLGTGPNSVGAIAFRKAAIRIDDRLRSVPFTANVWLADCIQVSAGMITLVVDPSLNVIRIVSGSTSRPQLLTTILAPLVGSPATQVTPSSSSPRAGSLHSYSAHSAASLLRRQTRYSHCYLKASTFRLRPARRGSFCWRTTGLPFETLGIGGGFGAKCVCRVGLAAGQQVVLSMSLRLGSQKQPTAPHDNAVTDFESVRHDVLAVFQETEAHGTGFEDPWLDLDEYQIYRVGRD
jgi:hypothetical protein